MWLSENHKMNVLVPNNVPLRWLCMCTHNSLSPIYNFNVNWNSIKKFYHNYIVRIHLSPPTHAHMHTYTHTHTHTHVCTSSQLEVCNFPYSVYFRFLKFLYTDQVESENLTLDETISMSVNSLEWVTNTTFKGARTIYAQYARAYHFHHN